MDKRSMTAATVETIVLSILARQPSYGYDIIRQVSEMTGGAIEWAAGSLYPVLHRLELDARVESYWMQPEGERKRKYYRITEHGLAALEREKQNWSTVQNLFDQLWSPLPSTR